MWAKADRQIQAILIVIKGVLYTLFRLVVEFPATGGAITSSVLRSVKLLRYVTAWDYFVMACELIFCLFIFYYIMEEVLEVSKTHVATSYCTWQSLRIAVLSDSLASTEIFQEYMELS